MSLWPETSVTSDPFAQALSEMGAMGLDFKHVLWVLPRIEAAGRFKAQWIAYFGQTPCLAPHIQTADRLSQPSLPGTWLNMKANLVGVLRGMPSLVGGLSTEQLWPLAQEYLELAMRLVLVREHDPSAWANYVVSNRFSAQEAQVVAQLADAFADDLLACFQKPASAPHAVHQIVWFDDAEQVPALWFKRFFPDVPVHRMALLQVEGAAPWVQLANNRTGQVKVSVAPDETTQAQQAAEQVLQWLVEDSESEIAIAVLDRLAARRLVAVLAEQHVMVDDRTGWRLSTSNVAGWFDELLHEHASNGQVNAFSHPFTGEPIEGLSPWAMMGTHTMGQWALALMGLLKRTQMAAVLLGDEAGRLIMNGLRQMSAMGAEVQLNAREFLSAWRHWAESERFRPLDIESRVRLLPLMSTRLRRFDKVLVLGCAQSHFQESPPGLLPPSVAQELGFPGPRIARIQKLSALYELMLGTPKVRLAHAQMSAGKPATLLPELQWFDIVLNREAGLAQAHGLSPTWLVRPADLQVPVELELPAPLVLSALPGGASVPEALPVTALDDFVACPLRFALKHSLPWLEAREKSAYGFEQLRGIFIHKVLEKTAREMGRAGANADSLTRWKQTLLDHGEQILQTMDMQDRATLHAFMAQFEKLVPRIAGSLMTRRIEGGWVFEGAERVIEGALELRQLGRSIRLKGRVDRVDVRHGEVAVSDIKFKQHSQLKKWAANPLSSPQLPAYQYLLARQAGQPHAALSFLGIHKSKVGWVDFAPLPDELTSEEWKTWGDVLFAQIENDMTPFFSGAVPWSARPGEACAWCDVHDVCRPGDGLEANIDESASEGDEA